MPTITIRDVAREAGVNISSVSRILRGVDDTFSAETEQRVREVATRLGYQANAAARLLRQQRSKMIGLGAPVTVRPHLNHLLVAAHEELRRHGYDPIHFEPTQLVPSRSHAPFPSIEMLAGMLCVDFSLEEEFPEICESVYSQLPVVALYPTRSLSAFSVYTDLTRGIELAVEHLVELGHSCIAFADVTGGFHPAAHLKMRGWHNAIARHGLNSPSEYLLTTHHLDPIAEMATQTARMLLNLKRRPTALICESDEVALRVMGLLGKAGLRVPQDISIVGFDGIEWGECALPALTTVAQPIRQIAEAAVSGMIEQINARALPEPESTVGARPRKSRAQLCEPVLVVRDSTAPPNGRTGVEHLSGRKNSVVKNFDQ